LLEQGHAAGRIHPYARGLLVCWTLDESLNLSPDPAFLRDSLQGRIAVAQPELAPYGLAARAYLQAFGLWDSLQPRLVFGESIAQVNQYVLSGAAPLGFTAKSVVLAPDLRSRGRWLEVDARHYPPIEQGAVMTRFGKAEREADCRQFLDFLLSPGGQRILERYGYLSSRTD
jgi:molybdate transport system substrate-binding protein